MRDTDAFWKGKPGDEYTARNAGTDRTANEAFFENALVTIDDEITSILELGANVGHNMVALATVCPEARLSAVEINAGACKALRELGIDVYEGSLLNIEALEDRAVAKADLVLTKGVLIHIAPDDLQAAYRAIYKATKRWILIAEYYSPSPVEIPYRGQAGKLWKRDFAGELWDAYPDLTLLDYGFVYRRERYPQDDINWFLLEKRA